MWWTQGSPLCSGGCSMLVGVPPHSTGCISLFTEQCAQYTGSWSRMNVRPLSSRSVRYACSPSYRPSSMSRPPVPQRNDSTILSSSSSTSTVPVLLTIARAMTFARGRRGQGAPIGAGVARGATDFIARLAHRPFEGVFSRPLADEGGEGRDPIDRVVLQRPPLVHGLVEQRGAVVRSARFERLAGLLPQRRLHASDVGLGQHRVGHGPPPG